MNNNNKKKSGTLSFRISCYAVQNVQKDVDIVFIHSQLTKLFQMHWICILLSCEKPAFSNPRSQAMLPIFQLKPNLCLDTLMHQLLSSIH